MKHVEGPHPVDTNTGMIYNTYFFIYWIIIEKKHFPERLKECGTEIAQRGLKLYPNNYNSCLNPNCTIKPSLDSSSTKSLNPNDSKVIAPWDREIPVKEQRPHLKPAPPGTTALIHHGFVSKTQKV